MLLHFTVCKHFHIRCPPLSGVREEVFFPTHPVGTGSTLESSPHHLAMFSFVKEQVKSSMCDVVIQPYFGWAHLGDGAEFNNPRSHTRHIHCDSRDTWVLKLAQFATSRNIRCCPSPSGLIFKTEKEEEGLSPLTVREKPFLRVIRFYFKILPETWFI